MQLQPDNIDSANPPARLIWAIGASVRQVVSSLRRVRLASVAADLYCDRDTQSICQGRALKLQRLKDVIRLREKIRDNSAGLLFAGGLEGADVVAAEASHWTKPLFCNPKQIRRLADPALLNAVMNDCGLNRYPLVPISDLPGSILPKAKPQHPSVIKDLARSGTAKVLSYGDPLPDSKSSSNSSLVLQPWIDGRSVSVVFCGSQHRARWIGASHQWVGKDVCNCKSLTWCGSVGGLDFSDAHRETAMWFADSLVAEFELVGLFGVDFVINEDGIWPVDVNPRIPASLDVVGEGLIGLHLNSYDVDFEPEHPPRHFNDGVRAKAILFNPFSHAIGFPESIIDALPFEHTANYWRSSIADVPVSGTTVRAGAPVLTTYAFAESVQAATKKLERQIGLLNEKLVANAGIGRPQTLLSQ